MARNTTKKTETEVSQPKKAATKKRFAALSEERTHRLRKDQLFKYRTLEAEVRAAQAEYQMADLQYQVLVNSRPDIVRAQTAKKAAQEHFRKMRDEYRHYMDELGKMLGLDMAKVAIDDTTGLVREIPASSPEKEKPQ